MLTATGPWTPIRTAPAPGRSYLISASYGGIETCDVAFYNGTRADGSHWWTLGNVEIAHAAIDHYAEILPPVIPPRPAAHFHEQRQDLRAGAETAQSDSRSAS